MTAIAGLMVLLAAVAAVTFGVFDKPEEPIEASPAYVETLGAEEEAAEAGDGVNMGSEPAGEEITGQDVTVEIRELPEEEQERVTEQREAEQTAQEAAQQPVENNENTEQPTTQPEQKPQVTAINGTAGTADFNGSPARAFNDVSELNGLKPIKPFETVMINGTPYGWTGSEWGDATGNLTVGGGGVYKGFQAHRC